MEVFYIIITCVFIVLLLAAIIMWIVDGKMENARKDALLNRVQNGTAMRVEEDGTLYLKVEDGVVSLCGSEAPAQAAPAASAAPAEEKPVVEAYEETAADAVEDEDDNLQELVEKYGEITDNSVVFEANKQQKESFIDKYAALSAEDRNRYDSIVAYILSNADCRKVEASNAVTFKCKTDKIMRAVIKRGVVVLNFLLINTDLGRFVREEGIKAIKINPVVIKLESDSDLLLAKQTADITIENIREEQQYRKERNKELRRRRYRQQEEENKEEENS